MTLAQLRAKWATLASELEGLGALVPAGQFSRAFLEDLERLATTPAEELLTLREASAYSGYSEAHLARLVREGRLPTLRDPGARGRHTFRKVDLPQKPCAPHTVDAGVHDLASRLYRGKEGRHGRP
jgi:hypothetical protein